MLLDPDLLDRLPDDLHEFILVDKAGQGRDDQGQRDAGDHDTQVLEVIEKGLFLFRIHLVPEFEHFGEKKHAAGL